MTNTNRWSRQVALVLCFFVALGAGAQARFGVKGGLDLTEMRFSHDVFNAENRTGWFIGPTLQFTLPIVGIGMDISALYNQRTTQIDDLYVDAGNGELVKAKDLKTRQIVVPLNARYTIGLSSVFNVFAFAGPQLAFRLGDEDRPLSSNDGEDALVWRMKESNFSVNLGAGITLDHLQVSVNYNVGVGKAGEVTFRDATHALGDAVKGHYNSWQLSATWFF